MSSTFTKVTRFLYSHKILTLIILFLLEFIIVQLLVQGRIINVVILWLTILSAILLWRWYHNHSHKEEYKNLLIQLILNLKGESGSWFGILSIIYVVINLNWLSMMSWITISDYHIIDIYNGISSVRPNNFDFWMLNSIGIFFTKFFLILIFLLLPFILLPYRIPASKSDSKILVTGISLLCRIDSDTSDQEIMNSLDKLDDIKALTGTKEFDYFNVDKNIWGRWDSIRKSLEKHHSIEHVLLLISPDVRIFFERIKKLDRKYSDKFNLELLIKNYSHYNNIKIYKSREIDYYIVQDAKVNIDEALKRFNFTPEKDGEILFNITCGTAALSCAMILHALKGERKAEYLHQHSGEIIPIDINVLTIQDLWDEIIMMMQKRIV